MWNIYYYFYYDVKFKNHFDNAEHDQWIYLFHH